MKYFLHIAIPIAIGSLLLIANCFSQSYNFKNYSPEQGLPYVQVYAIFQDSKGNLWTGGYGGLSKFDGKKFTNYSPKNGLANHWVTSIAEDAQGNIWVGTITGISKFDGKNFSTYTTKHGLAGDHVNSLSADRNGNLWIATSEGITIYNGKNFVSLTTKNGLSANDISLIHADNGGNIWMSSDSGVSKIIFISGGAPQDQSFDNYYIVNKIYTSAVRSMTEDAAGRMWFATGHGVVRYDGVDFEEYTTGNGLYDNDVLTVVKDEHSDAIWAGTMKGLNKITPLAQGSKVESFRISQIQNGNKVSKLFTDEEGNLWLGTMNGLYRFRDAAFSTYSQEEGLNNPFIVPIFRDSRKNLWVGTLEDGFYKYDNKKFTNISGKDGLIGTQMYSGIEDKSGNIWMGSNKGASIYNGRSFRNIPGRKGGLHGDSVTAMLQDSKGRIWLGGNKGGTIYFPSPGGEGKLKTFDLRAAEGQNFDVWYIYEDKGGNIWFGTYLGGLFRYDGKKYEDYRAKLGIKSTTCFGITEDKDGILYFGTFDGVYMYDPATGKISSLSEKQGLSSDLVYVMIFDSAYENLYIGTNQGVNRFDVKEYKGSGKVLLKQYGTEEGFSSLETNSSGAWRDSDGTIWFGTVNGLIHFDPSAIYVNHTESKTTISNIRIFYNDTLLQDNCELPYYLNNISFEYIGICLTNPETVRYKFMLEGAEKKWSPETRETFARYSNLPPGRYTFKVISCNNEGLWNREPAAFSFTILPPIWKRWWFITALSVGVVALVVVFSRLRAEAIRRKEAEKLSREIQMANNELKALRAQMDPHFIFNSLSSIQSFIMTKDEESALRYLNKFAKLMRMILSNSERSAITIREEMDTMKLYLELEALRWDRKFEYSFTVDPKVEVDFHKIPTMLIQPFVENAILHGVVPATERKGKIEVSISETDTHIICIVADNGIGRKKSHEMQVSSSQPRHESMGIKITTERLEMLNKMQRSNLSVKVTDLEDAQGNGTGTKVEIYIPVS